MRPDRFLAGSVAAVALFGVAACGGKTAEAPQDAVADSGIQCVQLADLAEGQYHWNGTTFAVSTTPPEAASVPVAASRASDSWVTELERSFPDAGFPWMGLHVSGPVAVLTGLAPDPTAKEQGFLVGQTALEENAEVASGVTLVVDGISVEEGERGVGEALAALSDGAATARRCQTAFNATMSGRTIMFQSNLAIISPTSERLLDALTGVALLCDSYAIEIGAHTDSRGSNQYNEVISQQRSDAVREYMIARGVDAEALTAKGYGESRPLDPAETYEAWAKNRRMEFLVSERR